MVVGLAAKKQQQKKTTQKKRPNQISIKKKMKINK